MEISQITGAGKDPVAHVEEDKQLKGVGAIPVVQPIGKDQNEKKSTPEELEPLFEHLRHEPLQLLLRAVSARLTQTFGAAGAVRHIAPAVEQALTPEVVCGRILVLLGAAFEGFKLQRTDSEIATVLAAFLPLANDALQQGGIEAREVLNNLNMLDASAAAEIDNAVALSHTALAHFPS